jgi:hypothetical protein
MRRNRDEAPSSTSMASVRFPPAAKPGLSLSTRGVSLLARVLTILDSRRWAAESSAARPTL